MAVSQNLSISQSSQDVAANTSKVRIVWTSTQTGTSYNGYTKTAYYYVSINGGAETQYAVNYTLPKGTTKTIVDTTLTVAHRADGTGSIRVRTWMNTGISAGTVTQDKTLNLTTIPRATQPTLSASSVDMGGSVTISLPRASSSFTHDLAYSFAGGDYKSIKTGVGASYSWTVPDLASSVPNATSGTITIRCITKSGSTSIGTKTVTLTAKVPSSVVPTISTVAAVEATSGIAAQFGAFVQGKSKVAVTITAAGAKGSTIKSYSSTLGGRTYTGRTWTSAVLTSSGSLSIVTTVTDSRGRTAKKTTTISVTAYYAPRISAFSAYRCNADGVAADDGTRLKFAYTYEVAPVGNKNTASVELHYKKSSDTAWSSSAIWSSTALNADSSTLLTTPTFSTDYQYDLRLTLEDWFGATVVYLTFIPSGAVILDISADGLGIAFGKTSDRSGADFGWAAKGAVFGLWEATAGIPENGDLNDYLRPGIYSTFNDARTETIANCPSKKAGTLRVYTALGTSRLSGAYAYIMQEFRSRNTSEPLYRRLLSTDSNGTWIFNAWVSDGATAAAASLGTATLNEEG